MAGDIASLGVRPEMKSPGYEIRRINPALVCPIRHLIPGMPYLRAMVMSDARDWAVIAERSAPWAAPVPGVAGRMRASELMAWPEDEWGYELVAGCLVRRPPGGRGHGHLVMALLSPLFRFVDATNAGLLAPPRTGFHLSQSDHGDTVLAPTIAFVNAVELRKLQPEDEERYITIPPNLAIEITAPDQHGPAIAAKARLYLELGVGLIWLFWPRHKRVDVWRAGSDQPVATLGIADHLDGEDILPGFSYPLTQLFVG